MLKYFLPLLFFSTGALAATVEPDMLTVLDELQTLQPKPIETLTAAEARLQPTVGDAVRSLLAKKKMVPDALGLARVYDLTVAGLPARAYRPVGSGALPITVYFHGGGWVLSDLDGYESSAFALAKHSGSLVISVEYRKAPEHKFPAAHEDASLAYQWVMDHAADLGGDPKRIAVAGESAGGNLALNVALKARADGLPVPVRVLAIYPVAGSDLNSASYAENASAKPLNKPMMDWFFSQYLNSPAERLDPRINLVERRDLAGLPPVTIIAADADPLRAEDQLLADRLRAAGVTVELQTFAGTTHEFFGLADVLNSAVDAQKFAAQELKKGF